MNGENSSRGLPFPDPFGILESVSGGMFYDPLISAREIKKAAEEEPKSAFDVKLARYIMHLEEAYRSAPCPGCTKIIESALVAAEIFRRMQETGKSASEVKEDEIEDIRQKVKDHIATLV